MSNTFIDPNLFSAEFFPHRDLNFNTSPLFPAGYDISFLLPSSFLDVAFWQQYLKAIAAVFESSVVTPARSLAYIRLPETQDRVFKALHSGLMAYDVPDEIMTDELYDATNQHLGHYAEAQGRDNFVRFVGWTLDIDLRLTRLWTKDYKTFFPSYGAEKPIWLGGDWYPTTHVGLSYDMNGREDLTEDDLRERFYKNAPIELVLKWIAKMQTFSIGTLYLSLFTFVEIENKNILNGRGDLDLYMNMDVLALIDIGLHHNAINMFDVDNRIGVASCSQNIFYSHTIADYVIWTNADKLPGRYRHRRYSEAWQYTGIGKGKWTGQNIARINAVNPVTGDIIGLQYEDLALNYIRSSAKFGTAPWKIESQVSVLHSESYATGMDGTNGTKWSTGSGTAYMSQVIYLEKDDYTLQIAFSKTGNLAGKIEGVYKDGSTHAFKTFNSAGVSIGGQWRLFTFSISKDDVDYDGEFFSLKLSVELTTSPVEIFITGLEQGSVATSFIRTDDCNVGRRTDDSATFEVINYNARENGVIQGTFGVDLHLGNPPFDIVCDEDTKIVSFEVVAGAGSDGLDYDRAGLQWDGSQATYTIREIRGQFVETQTLTLEAEPVTSIKVISTWRQPYIVDADTAPEDYESDFGLMVGNTITEQSLGYEFSPVRVAIEGFSGYIKGMLWIPTKTDLETTLSLNW